MMTVVIAEQDWDAASLPVYLRDSLGTRPRRELAIALADAPAICEGRGWRAVECSVDWLRRHSAETGSELERLQIARMLQT